MPSPQDNPSLLEQWIGAAKNKKPLAMIILATTVLLAIGGAFEAVRKIAETLQGLGPDLHIAKLSVREVEDKIPGGGLNQNQWKSFIDVTLQNSSEDPIIITDAVLHVVEFEALSETKTLGGGVKIAGSYAALIPTDDPPFDVPVASVNFGLIPNSNDRFEIDVDVLENTVPYAIRAYLTLGYLHAGKTRTLTSSKFTFLRQGEYHLLDTVALPDPNGSFFLGTLHELSENVRRNKAVFAGLDLQSGYVSDKLLQSNAVMEKARLPLEFVKKLEHVSARRSSHDGKWDIGLPDGVRFNPDFRVNVQGLIRLAPGEKDGFASGWSYAEIETEQRAASSKAGRDLDTLRLRTKR